MRTRLADSAVLELHGPDALAFAHLQLMNDVRALNVGAWQWSGWLTPRGRVVAFFALIRRRDDSLLLWLPAGGAEPLRERLQRYVFRSKLTLNADPAWQAIACFDREALPPEAELSIALPTGGDEQRRLAFIAPAADLPVTTALPGDDAIAARWRLADLQLGVPYIAAGAPNSEQFVPQWLSLERLSAFDLKKGCYPGQEIVARMHYLGQSKRAAFRLSGSGTPPAPLARVLDGAGGGLGEIVWAQADGADWHALAVLQADRAAQAYEVEGSGSVEIELEHSAP